MNHMETTYGSRIYAGVLGKILGVYLGRPVEGWAYEKIRSTFGALTYYKHRDCGVPLIVADDDISGTFAFFRALEDCGYPRDLTAQDVGNAWLNYNIEDKTILWWGGLGRSTEHTAYLNLKAGIPAPRSGSMEQNGQTLAEQIGAQIFMDAFAMACPEDPELAAHLVRNAASVSHDGVALDAACYLAAMEAMAFGERRMDKLMDEGLRFVTDSRLLSLVEGIEVFEPKRVDECCGFGGLFSIEEAATSVCMGQDKVRDHISTGAEYITGADSSCLMHMEGIIRREKLPIRTKHIVEILASQKV